MRLGMPTGRRRCGLIIALMLPGARKSVEPMAARVESRRVGAMHQAMHHFVANAPWDDEAILAAVRERALPAINGI